ncbi:MAG: response regulator [Rhodospirillaceae bacterium]|nr:response regulator [Rhodospirillales bacterium]
MRWLTRSDAGISLATATLYALVLAGGAATLYNLKTFRDNTLIEAHQQMIGLAATLSSHLPVPFDGEAEGPRLAPLQEGLGQKTIIAVLDREDRLMMSVPPESGTATLPLSARTDIFPLGTFDARWPGDGIDRIWGYAVVEDQPMVVLVGVSHAQITAAVVQLAWHMTALMAAVTAATILLAHLLRHLQLRRRVEVALKETSHAAVVAAQAKSAFLANMSHELRTPMTGVLGMADLLMGTPLDQEQSRMLSTMQASARTLLTVLNDVLDVSKVEAGQMELECIDFDLHEITNDAVRLLTPGAAEKGLSLYTSIADTCPRWVKGDPARLQQVLFNLIGNAIKFTDDGGVTIGLHPDGEEIAFMVADTGIGMAPESLAGLFTPFTQADASTTRRYGGTGLGLAIAKRLVSLMGGDMTAQSTLGAGSTFSFTLALPVGQPPKVGETDSLGPRTRPLKVLVAEDNPVNQTLVAHMLERMGHSATVVEHGAVALEMAAAVDYDVILMDMQMPVMDGETATRLIRTLPGRRATVPVIALTADAVLEHRDRYVSAGLDAFLTKPVSWKLLARTLDEAAARRPPMEPPAPTIPAPEPQPMPEAQLDEAPPQGPILDVAYLEDMRQWVGDDTLVSLLATAPDSFNGELSAIGSAWERGDLNMVRETAHRLKGAAGSIGCRRLSDLAHRLQKMDEAELSEAGYLDTLTTEISAALCELAQWRPKANVV